ncbi:uncharacterized protein LOC116987523 isoform X3 [Amblyraja radiata]|uniref:uncharacterized protein LOC116987523 isoform X3 n=1 Tax=Amblyraja radiata TaxID=386614 RepID=UPI00140270B0|nr:uncharacterized protein LOC116987523 isoform X3 [Amblyraja radiata]
MGMETESQVQTETPSGPIKDHCDYLMDSIDAQLSQMQFSNATSPAQPATESATFWNGEELHSSTGRLGQEGVQRLIGPRDVTVSCSQNPGSRSHPDVPFPGPGREAGDGDSRRRQYEWRVQCLLGPQQMQEDAHHSDSNSVCTEDFATRFHEGMVDPVWTFDSGSEGRMSLGSQDSLEEVSQESTGLHPGSPESEASDHPREGSCGEKVGHDPILCGRNHGVALWEISGRIRPSRSIEKREPVGSIEEEVVNPASSPAEDREIVQQFQELEHVLLGSRSLAGPEWDYSVPQGLSYRTGSVESLGHRISKLSRNNMSEQRNPPLGNGIRVPISALEPPVNPDPRRDSTLVSSSSPATAPGEEKHEGLSSDLAGVGVKLRETTQRVSRDGERLGRDVHPEPPALSSVCVRKPIPLQQGNPAPRFQEDAVPLNGCRSPYHAAHTSVFRHTANAGTAPASGRGAAEHAGEPTIAGQREGMSGSLVGGSESLPWSTDPSRDRPVPPPACRAWRSSVVGDRCPVTPHSPDPPRHTLTGSSLGAKATRQLARSSAPGGYRGSLSSPQGKPPPGHSGEGFQADAGVNGNHSARTHCTSTTERSRYAGSQQTVTYENFAERSNEQRNSTWNPRFKDCLNHSWRWNRSPQVSSTLKLVMGDRQSPKMTMEKDLQEPRSLEAPAREMKSESDQARTESVNLGLGEDGRRQELRDAGRGNDLNNTPNQNMTADRTRSRQLEGLELGQEQRAAELTQLLERNSNLESRVQELERSLEAVTAKHEESLSLRDQVWPSEEAMKKLSEELKQEAKMMVQNALAQEYKKWEADREEQLQQQQSSLKEENERAITQSKEELAKERWNSLALQNKIIELQKRVQELELRSRSLQQEKEQAVRDVAEDKQRELQQLRKEMQLEKEREVKRLAWKVEQSERELANLQSRSSEATVKRREAQEQREQAEGSLVSTIRKECEHLQALIRSTRGRVLAEAVSPSSRELRSPSQMTLGEALHTLHTVGEDMHQLVMDLQQELETKWQKGHSPQKDKEREVRQHQGEQFLLEKEKALAAIEDRLLQNRNEVSRLQSSPVPDCGSEEEHTLTQQLLEKATESRTVQRNIAKWTFEEELNEELEKDVLKNTIEHQKKIEKLENEIHQLSLEHSENSHLRCVSTPSMASSTVISFRQQDFGTLKLFRHLQSRVKQLRAENRIYHGTGLEDVNTLHIEAGNSYKKMNQLKN